jgi:hypothetical protein
MNDAGSWILLVGRILFALNFAVVVGYGFHVAKTQMADGRVDHRRKPFDRIRRLRRCRSANDRCVRHPRGLDRFRTSLHTAQIA